MAIPTPYEVQREPAQSGATDSHGNTVRSWGSSVPVPVHGWSPPGQDGEPGQANRTLVVRDLDLYAPAGTAGAPGDRWTIDGVQYLEVGHPEDFTKGPWPNPAAGVRVNLIRHEG